MYLTCVSPAVVLAFAVLTSSSALPSYDKSMQPDESSNTPTPDLTDLTEAPAYYNLAEAVSHADNPVISKDNTCGKLAGGKNKGFSCDAEAPFGGPCCSAYGQCGKGPAYCGKGCQKEFGTCDGASPGPAAPKPQPLPKPAPIKLCGSKNYNLKCDGGMCCSAAGTCGNTPDLCGKGCQTRFGTCTAKPITPPKPAPKPKDAGGLCGPQNKNTICPNGLCCSAEGYCGHSEIYCMSPQCQHNFGRCDSDDVPAGVNTSTDARPLIGHVSYDVFITSCTQPGVISLTYDDGPELFTMNLLDLLNKNDFKATFFVSANNNGKGEIDVTSPYPAVLKRMVAEGHQIASHTFAHSHLSSLSSWERKNEMYRNERAIANIIGKYPTYMRPPYDECTPDSGCVADMKALGYHRIGWDMSTADYLHPTADQIHLSKEVTKRFLDSQPEDGHALLIQHDIIEQSAGNLTQFIIDEAVKKGWKGVTVGECLGDDPANWYREPEAVTPGTFHDESCIVSNKDFCGKIQSFKDKKECFMSNSNCYSQLDHCFLNDHKHECDSFKSICNVQLFFCTQCGGKGGKTCETKNFAYDRMLMQ